ncbi:MAG: oxidoreductase [Micromonosporaceae bacterium]
MTSWTTSDIPDLRGLSAVVTGANNGLGLVTARELARAGARTVLACRSVDRGERAATTIRDAHPEADVTVAALDLADLTSVRRFADSYTADHDGLDLLVNNAGVMALPYGKTPDGFEVQFGTNHLGHFALTGLLLDALRKRPAPRVVTLSSLTHHYGRIQFGNLQSERWYSTWMAYASSKLANLLFTYELHRRTGAAGSGLRGVAAHPGWAATNLQFAGAEITGSWLRRASMWLGNLVLAQDDEQGALPSLYAATAPDLPGGSYVGPDGWMELRGYPTVVKPSRAARDPDTARRLWHVSEELTGVRYTF